MDSRYNLPFPEDSSMKKLLSDLVNTLKHSDKSQSDEYKNDIAERLEMQSLIISRITEEKLQKFDPMQLDSLENDVVGCQQLLHKMIQDIQMQLELKNNVIKEKPTSIKSNMDPFEQVQSHLQKQDEALEHIRDKIVMARVLRNAKDLENIQAPLFAGPANHYDQEVLAITLKNYFLAIEADLERSYDRQKAHKEFVQIAKSRITAWPENIKARYLKELENYLTD